MTVHEYETQIARDLFHQTLRRYRAGRRGGDDLYAGLAEAMKRSFVVVCKQDFPVRVFLGRTAAEEYAAEEEGDTGKPFAMRIDRYEFPEGAPRPIRAAAPELDSGESDEPESGT